MELEQAGRLESAVFALQRSCRAVLRSARLIWERGKRMTTLVASLFESLKSSWKSAADAFTASQFYKERAILLEKRVIELEAQHQKYVGEAEMTIGELKQLLSSSNASTQSTTRCEACYCVRTIARNSASAGLATPTPPPMQVLAPVTTTSDPNDAMDEDDSVVLIT